VTADHQYYNAKAVADAGGAIIVRENADTAEKVLEELRRIDADRDRLEAMKKASRSIAPEDAVDIIYNTVVQTCKR
jgi:UDP-N-acetylglucosamine--N-acetylmuramyl-(pentapeptide) pyrophosphoryl-undecaprenol N-acetylglucosamine transferase